MDRRNFLKRSAVTVTGLSLNPLIGKYYSSVFGQSAPGNKIKIGLIGCRNQGWANLKTFLDYPGTECISLCDVDDQWLYQRAADVEKITGKKPVLLMDDVLLEMDPEKRRRIMNLLPEYDQLFCTFLPGEPYEKYKHSGTRVYLIEKGSWHEQ